MQLQMVLTYDILTPGVVCCFQGKMIQQVESIGEQGNTCDESIPCDSSFPERD